MTDSAQWAYNRPHYFTATVATDGANKTLVTILVKDANGRTVSVPKHFDLYLSDSAVGAGYSATTASGAVTVKTAGTTGTLLGTLTASFGLRVQTTAAGSFGLSITDTAKTAFKVCGEIDGVVYVIATLSAASYA